MFMIKAIVRWSLSFVRKTMADMNSPFPAVNVPRRKKLAIKILVKSVIYAFALFGILFILLLLAVLGLIRQEAGPAAVIPAQTVLQINFDNKFSETRGDTLLSEFSESRPLAFYDLTRAIEAAAEDKRIKAIAARVSVSELGLAQIEELRAAISQFRKSGKPAYLFSSGFGSFGRGISEYYLATAFDQIWLQPGGEVGITGISLEVPFLRKLLDKIGIEPEFYSRYEYKTAMASLTDEKMSKPFREDMTKLGKSLFNQLVEGIAASRGLAGEEVVKLVNRAPLSLQAALDGGLVDKSGYWEDMVLALDPKAEIPLTDIYDYAAVLNDYSGRKSVIAVINAEGVISEGPSTDSPLQGEAVVGSDTIRDQLAELAENKNVKAVVLRVNSPGGSYTASNAVWHALKTFKAEQNIPLIVSMGDYAASGGYFIALAGDKLVAEPSTLTGSIGVLGGKMVLSGLWDKLGVDWQEINFGDNAGILSPNRNFTKKEKDIFNKSLDNIYSDFTLKVAQARGFDKAKTEQVARGRVWTGAGAKEVGLVDELGGLNTAFEIARAAAKIRPDEKIGVIYYPKKKSLSEKIGELLSSAPMASVSRLKSVLGADVRQLEILQRLDYDLMMVPVHIGY